MTSRMKEWCRTNPKKYREQVKVQLEREKRQRRNEKALRVSYLKKALGCDFIPILCKELKTFWNCPEQVREIEDIIAAST